MAYYFISLQLAQPFRNRNVHPRNKRGAKAQGSQWCFTWPFQEEIALVCFPGHLISFMVIFL